MVVDNEGDEGDWRQRALEECDQWCWGWNDTLKKQKKAEVYTVDSQNEDCWRWLLGPVAELTGDLYAMLLKSEQLISNVECGPTNVTVVWNFSRSITNVASPREWFSAHSYGRPCQRVLIWSNTGSIHVQNSSREFWSYSAKQSFRWVKFTKKTRHYVRIRAIYACLVPCYASSRLQAEQV